MAVVMNVTPEDNADLEKLNPSTKYYKMKRNERLCHCCYEMAIKIVSNDYIGIQLVERYCDTHVKRLNIHLLALVSLPSQSTSQSPF